MDEQNSVECNVCHIGFPDKKALIGHVVTFFDTISVPPIPENSPLEFGSNDGDHMHTNRSVVPDLHGGVSKIKLMRMNPTRKRSERRRREMVNVIASPPPLPVISSVSENFSDEEIARCLLRLSRDEWLPHGVEPVFENMEHEEEVEVEVEVVGEEDKNKPVDENIEHEKKVEIIGEKDEDKQVFENILEHEEDKGVGEKEEQEQEEEDDDDDDLFCLPSGNGRHFKTKGRKRYRCERCKMNFASYQALGGHKANHKRTKKFHIKRGDGYVHSKPNNNNNNNNNVLGEGNIATTYNVVGGCGRGRGRGRGVSSYHNQIQKSRFECQFCDKVFQSGQALGGHKKVHYSYLSVANPTPLVATPTVSFHIDLNLPAALEVEHN
ncbi:hypothetical protein LWI28_010162 [Acer negundo]|uniref:C2H2-type domain-containing protein n=1 Tax=Acer negundo TaxID=4023 RepID=A0AAD5NJA3_ACENE|nr:hypothetical protein LWI28_010162 [Acer negundo]KAK4836813.1 hypothetical protein QYF36_000401 [Acer negundo]